MTISKTRGHTTECLSMRKKINLYVLLLDTPEQGPLFQKILRFKVIRTKV